MSESLLTLVNIPAEEDKRGCSYEICLVKVPPFLYKMKCLPFFISSTVGNIKGINKHCQVLGDPTTAGCSLASLEGHQAVEKAHPAQPWRGREGRIVGAMDPQIHESESLLPLLSSLHLCGIVSSKNNSLPTS